LFLNGGNGSCSAQLLRLWRGTITRLGVLFGTCGLAPLVGERLLDQLANDEFHELRGFLDGDTDGFRLVPDLALEIRREADSLFAQLVLQKQKRDLTFPDVVHDGPPECTIATKSS